MTVSFGIDCPKISPIHEGIFKNLKVSLDGKIGINIRRKFIIRKDKSQAGGGGYQLL